MKKIKKTLLAFTAFAILLTASGCYGSFTVTKKIYKWNGKVTDNKFANSIIMWALMIAPVYEICVFVDFVVLNTIEFWTGSNPLAMAADASETQRVLSGDKVFEVTATQNKFHIAQIEGVGEGQTIDLIYKSTEGAWYASKGAQEYKIAQGDISNNQWVKVFHPDGKVEAITMN